MPRTKPTTIRLTEVDRARAERIAKALGIGGISDAIRHALLRVDSIYATKTHKQEAEK